MAKKRGERTEAAAQAAVVGVGATTEAADARAGKGELQVRQLTQVQLDPTQPRKLLVGPDEVIAFRNNGFSMEGLGLSDVQCDQMETLHNLALSIKHQGLVQPTAGYEAHTEDNGYRVFLIAGERRFLAHLMMELPTIDIIIRPKPKHKEIPQDHNIDDTQENRQVLYELHLLDERVVENVQREAFTLAEYILFIQDYEAKFKQLNLKFTGDILATRIGLKKAQAFKYLKVARGPKEIIDKIMSFEITSIEKAGKALKAYLENNETGEDDEQANKRGGGRPAKVSLGNIEQKHSNVIRTIVDKFSEEVELPELDWDNPDDVKKGWDALIEELTKLSDN